MKHVLNTSDMGGADDLEVDMNTVERSGIRVCNKIIISEEI